MSSPAERYAASRRRAAEQRTHLHDFRQRQEFDLDDFQLEACRALESGQGVLVAAPTGAGKTVVGEFAVHLGLAAGLKTFYTTPIKALSNQKYTDLAAEHGAHNVGLLTGDTSLNGEAPIVVMTTEVLRNMIYAGSGLLANLGYVVLDEVHYLADRFRGPVWEEVILNLAPAVRIVALSATVSNAEELGEWLTEVRGATSVVVSERRPVPLWQHMMVGSRLLDLYSLGEGHLDPTDVGADPPLNPELVDAIRQATRTGSAPARHSHGMREASSWRSHDSRDGRGRGKGGKRGGGKRGRSDRGGAGHHAGRSGTWSARDDRGSSGGRSGAARGRVASRPVVIEHLDRAGLLPAIVFIFSRAGCEAAVEQVLASGMRLTTREEAAHVREVVDAAVAGVPPEDLAVLGVDTWAVALERGVAAHHAGMLPVLKEAVEKLFTAGLVKVVFATETLALGVNMPARSVVLEKLVKWDGTGHVNLTPGEYTQLTGRAGRRGIDVEGHAVVQWRPGTDPVHVASLASRRTYPLRSAFHPTYNMAVNLLRHRSYGRSRELLESSFAQFQADRGVVGLARQVRRHEEALEGYARAMTCHLGDFTQYADLRARIKDREADLSRERAGERRAAARRTMTGLRRGDVLAWARGRRMITGVVLESDEVGFDGPTLTVLTEERKVRTIGPPEAPDGVDVVTRVRIPAQFNVREARSRNDLAASLRNALADARSPSFERNAAGSDEELARLRAQLRAHPCHGCSEREDHARWAHRWVRARRELDELLDRIRSRTGTLAVDLDHVCDVLLELGYLTDTTPEGAAGAAPGDSPDAGAREPAVTEDGRWLARLYAERDLVLAECLRSGAWDRLDAAGLAALVSTVVYESREDRPAVSLATAGATGLGAELAATQDVARRVSEVERRHGVRPTAPVDLGLVAAMHAWAGGEPLSRALQLCDLGAGDFVRRAKQVIDVLDQVAVAAPDVRLAQEAVAAISAVRRGVVAWSSI